MKYKAIIFPLEKHKLIWDFGTTNLYIEAGNIIKIGNLEGKFEVRSIVIDTVQTIYNVMPVPNSNL